MFFDSGEYMNRRGIPAPAGRWREMPGEHPLTRHRFTAVSPAALFLGDGRGGVANEQARHMASGEDEVAPGD